MPLTIIDGPTISAGESLSDGVDCSGGQMVRITFPQEFTDANVTFQVSSDGQSYNDLYSSKGEEITIQPVPDSGVVLTEAWANTIGWIKLRSGTRKNPVPQKVDCRFAIAVKA